MMKQVLTNLDFWGCTTSVLCALHCAALPLLLPFGLLGTHGWMTHPMVELSIISITCVFVYFSLIRQYLAERNNLAPVLLALAGMVLIAAHHLVELHSTSMVVCGGILVALAHGANILGHLELKTGA